MADLLPTPEIARLDVPLAELAADLQMVALKRAAAERLRAGALLEQRHQLLDLDADSRYTVPGCAYRNCLPGTGVAS
ncbi:hypothetical protein J7E97_07845 [Streptomyces sp. ISL-66]|uniref:hypothetical protein n=1 Tax=Streptomyces sp. ISL-66 TaxID=2819186 RepID=UPI001BEC8D6B|nr:hypothetical protein [Streptomyces sp. ISL-66]MBT2467785.1 hypothetical protein [Streptomyces sp. ISL-66]